MSALQKQVIQSLNGLSEDNLQFLLDMIQRFMKPREIGESSNDKSGIVRNDMRRIGSLEGQDLIDPDYDIDACNDEIAEIYLAYHPEPHCFRNCLGSYHPSPSWIFPAASRRFRLLEAAVRHYLHLCRQSG